jgi:integrase
MRAWYRLSASMVTNATRPGKYLDGGGLLLQVRDDGTKQWVFRYQRNKRERAMGLGTTRSTSLADARAKADDARRILAQGLDPIEQRRAGRQTEAAATARLTTVREVVRLYLAKYESKWSSPKHRREWESSLDRFVHPLIGNVAADDLEVAHVLKVVEPIWQRIPETARRTLGRLEELIDFARVAGLRSNDSNPARWRGHLDAVLPAPTRIKAKVHLAAMHWRDVPAFMARLRDEQGVAARALEFIVLTGVRMSEAIGAQWDEVDFKTRVWEVPAARIKMRKAHVVPLSSRALAILQEMRGSHATWVFPGRFAASAISDNAILLLLHRLAGDKVTAHGFRSSLRTWAAESSGFKPRDCRSHVGACGFQRNFAGLPAHVIF